MADAIRLPKLKYCGLTRAVDVELAIEAGADAIGLNFYEPSPRYVTPQSAQALQIQIAGRAVVVGVFVNATPIQIAEVIAICQLDIIQLHGDESPEWLEEASTVPLLQSTPIIKAIAWRDLEEDRINAQRWAQVQDPRFLGFLVDAYDPIQRGGTGKTARWDLLSPKPLEFADRSFLLAGGITPENVSVAIQTARPSGIDVASGIESSPGIKDPAKMSAISKTARPLLT